ncbi:hypothetical protein TVAG_124170 [Trichomonas vaginalis G3]|uniref:Uncharacterized protein n=1 Tax=Trichomonas vaginalis (strain ATCC PRA-98 / G3) TaxID=412133 RepID=A2EN07_TRIV3|nr:hypothetical protein TVAGG3_0743220 [Trichomonas vaginalis G3]EAY05992.1 hypothetical protein TVAG_124170 [Trichomonas vaginalis G3]KAI5512031.1 hypothetical protein TVAGG3_0743220 [Trichomonas vaginalis G3]|eukprot:XP_001318215.1 hypothetical protein [Trichomonas vaginalis G3]
MPDEGDLAQTKIDVRLDIQPISLSGNFYFTGRKYLRSKRAPELYCGYNNKNDLILSISLITSDKLQNLLAKVNIPLKWFPENLVVRDYFEMEIAPTQKYHPIVFIEIHLNENKAKEFNAPLGFTSKLPGESLKDYQKFDISIFDERHMSDILSDEEEEKVYDSAPRKSNVKPNNSQEIKDPFADTTGEKASIIETIIGNDMESVKAYSIDDLSAIQEKSENTNDNQAEIKVSGSAPVIIYAAQKKEPSLENTIISDENSNSPLTTTAETVVTASKMTELPTSISNDKLYEADDDSYSESLSESKAFATLPVVHNNTFKTDTPIRRRTAGTPRQRTHSNASLQLLNYIQQASSKERRRSEASTKPLPFNNILAEKEFEIDDGEDRSQDILGTPPPVSLPQFFEGRPHLHPSRSLSWFAPIRKSTSNAPTPGPIPDPVPASPLNNFSPLLAQLSGNFEEDEDSYTSSSAVQSLEDSPIIAQSPWEPQNVPQEEMVNQLENITIPTENVMRSIPSRQNRSPQQNSKVIPSLSSHSPPGNNKRPPIEMRRHQPPPSYYPQQDQIQSSYIPPRPLQIPLYMPAQK